jgi:hypothetical protein
MCLLPEEAEQRLYKIIYPLSLEGLSVVAPNVLEAISIVQENHKGNVHLVHIKAFITFYE